MSQFPNYPTKITLNGVEYTFPGADGSADDVLTTNGSGTLSWAAAGTTDRATFAGGDNAAGTFDRYLFALDNVRMTATRGYVMTRPGSIVGLGATFLLVSAGTVLQTSIVQFEVRRTTTTTPTTTLVVNNDYAGTGGLPADQKLRTTAAAGTYSFAAGDILTLYLDLSGTSVPSVDEVTAFFEVEY